MKTLFAILSLICLQAAFAQDVTELVKGDLSISQADATITNVRDICPATPSGIKCMAYGSVVEITVGLNGCMDTYGGHFSKFEVVDGKGVLYFSAINIANEKSKVTRCLVRPTRNVSVHVAFEGQIELVNTDFTAAMRK